ncbi:MAG: hypothetical protein LBT16_03860 [Treponema sp.]|nr:hypothetical protein [Treponema sp.]
MSRDLDVPIEGKKERRKEAGKKARALLEELRRFAPLPEPSGPAGVSLTPYLLDFWSPGSRYIREKAAVERKPLSAAYIAMSRENIIHHVQTWPGFAGITLGALAHAMIRDWKLWAAERGLSGRKINMVLQSMRVPVRDAYRDEVIGIDPFHNIREAAHTEKVKGILSPAEVQRSLPAPRLRITMPACRCC